MKRKAVPKPVPTPPLRHEFASIEAWLEAKTAYLEAIEPKPKTPKPKLAPADWPRLSRTLTGPVSPDRCQSCGAECDLERWREHDETDQPEQIIVVLCDVCSKRLIDKHPRLYSFLERNAPAPGAMTICLDCSHREGTWCPVAKSSGGPGVLLTTARPQTMHVSRSPRRNSGFITLYGHAPTACDQKQVDVISIERRRP